ncbi:hypothetical protein HYS31_05820 [Candidatus Woesearchaeota archaeon]|nr:hypothetical protein [Candidatus Woesearchaeota archaeon]
MALSAISMGPATQPIPANQNIAKTPDLVDQSDIGGLVLSSLISGPRIYPDLLYEVKVEYSRSHHGEEVKFDQIAFVLNQMALIGEINYGNSRGRKMKLPANEPDILFVSANPKTLESYLKIGGTE